MRVSYLNEHIEKFYQIENFEDAKSKLHEITQNSNIPSRRKKQIYLQIKQTRNLTHLQFLATNLMLKFNGTAVWKSRDYYAQ